MIDWNKLIETEEKTKKKTSGAPDIDWRNEAAYSLCELYYTQHRAQRYGSSQRIDLRPGSDFNRFMDSHMEPLTKHEVWEALFPNKESASTAGALDEALQLLADSKIVDRIYSGDIVTTQKLVNTIRKKRAKYLDNL